MTVVAIHQPNFFPWLGYFDKIAQADRFVFLDNVQMPLTGSSYINRVNILIGGTPQAIQVPTARGMEARKTISTTPMAPQAKWREKLLKTIHQSYARAPFAKDVSPVIEALMLNPSDKLGPFNENGIRALAGKIGISDRKFLRASELNTSGGSNELLIEIVKKVDGKTYLAGGGAEGYQQDQLFADAGLNVTYQRFSHPQYAQSGTNAFVPGLSIIDALMNLGFDGTRNLLRIG
ncbi:MAG: WbqC family protein [Rhizomicrobium sp.]